jgi:hypothetical protein
MTRVTQCICILGWVVLLSSCGTEVSETVNLDLPNNLNPVEAEQPKAEPVFGVQVFPNDTSGWGYDITIDGKPSIHQPHIPAISGNIAFASKSDALQVGQLMVKKIVNGEMPPSVTPAEMDSLGIVY